jgi:hypothetical protein
MHATVAAPPHAQDMRQEVGSRWGPEPGRVAGLVKKETQQVKWGGYGGRTRPRTWWVPPLGVGRERVCLGSLYPTDLETVARRVARFRREIIAVVRRLGCGREKGTRRRSEGMRGAMMWGL